MLTTSYRSTPTTSRRLQSPPRSASLSSLECRSACETLPNHFYVLWTVFSVTFRSCSCTSMTSSSPAKMKPNIDVIWRPYSTDLQKTASPSTLPSACSQLTHWISSATTFPLPEFDRWQRRSPTSESSRSQSLSANCVSFWAWSRFTIASFPIVRTPWHRYMTLLTHPTHKMHPWHGVMFLCQLSMTSSPA